MDSSGDEGREAKEAEAGMSQDYDLISIEDENREREKEGKDVE